MKMNDEIKNRVIMKLLCIKHHHLYHHFTDLFRSFKLDLILYLLTL